MDGERGESEVRGDAERETSEVSSNENGRSNLTVNGGEKEGVPAEEGASQHGNGNRESAAAAEGTSGDEPSGSDSTSSQDLDVKEVCEQLLSQEDSVVFEIDSDDDDGSPKLHLGTPEGEGTPGGDRQADPAEDATYVEHLQLLQELREQRDRASQRSGQLQAKLAEYLHKRAGDDALPEGGAPGPGQLQDYDGHISTLADLKRRLSAESEAARRRAEELRLQCQEKLDKAESEWQALVELKRDAAVAVLGRSPGGKQAAQARVEAALEAERRLHGELAELRLRHVRLRAAAGRLEAELREREARGGDGEDPLQLRFEQLRAARAEERRRAERRGEEAARLQGKISGGLELLSNVKEKLFWEKSQVRAKRAELAELEAAVARQRDLLVGTKRASGRLQADNRRLREGGGLLGHRVLLRDFEVTVDAAGRLEEELEGLRSRRAQIDFNCGGWGNKLET